MTIEQIDALLNQNSGLKGMCGSTTSVSCVLRWRPVRRRRSSLDIYVHRLRKYIGAYVFVLGRVDAIAFTAGVGENAANVREGALSGLEGRGIAVDLDRNRSGVRGARVISTDDSETKDLVVPTNEELAIARAAWEFV